MEIHTIDHNLFDASGQDNPILKDSVVERNLYNYLIFSTKLKLRLMPKKFNKLIPNLVLTISTKRGKVDGKQECDVNTDDIIGAEVYYSPEPGQQDILTITPFVKDRKCKTFRIMLTCTLIKGPMKKTFDIEAGKDFLEYLEQRMKDLDALATELDKKESVFSKLIDRAAILKEFEWAMGTLKELMTELGICIGIIEAQKKQIVELTDINTNLKHELNDVTFLRVQDQAAFDMMIKNKNKMIMELQEQLEEKEKELMKLTDENLENFEVTQVEREETEKVKSLIDEALEYLKPSENIKIISKKVKKP